MSPRAAACRYLKNWILVCDLLNLPRNVSTSVPEQYHTLSFLSNFQNLRKMLRSSLNSGEVSFFMSMLPFWSRGSLGNQIFLSFANFRSFFSNERGWKPAGRSEIIEMYENCFYLSAAATEGLGAYSCMFIFYIRSSRWCLAIYLSSFGEGLRVLESVFSFELDLV